MSNNKELDRMSRYKDILLTIIHTYLPQAKVYLFGSRARKDHREGSDIDVALDADTVIDEKTMFNISDAIEESLIPVFVDLLDYHLISDDMKQEIKRDGVQWKIVINHDASTTFNS